MITTFQELLEELHTSQPQPNPKYYHTLIEHSSIIVLEAAVHGNWKVAQQLKMTNSKFSNLFQVFREYATDSQRDTEEVA